MVTFNISCKTKENNIETKFLDELCGEGENVNLTLS
jgi:hypothetical protein